VTLDDADLLDAWAQAIGDSGGFNDLGQEPRTIDREALAEGPLRNERNGIPIIERIADNRPTGTVGWHRVGYGPTARSDAWRIGIELRPEARGQGHGTDAQRLLAVYLFETTEVNRVEAQTDVDNVAEQHALEKAGYRREGIARGAQHRAGSYHDLMTYAILRDDTRA
jgi:RimJ/RimL family protein N-acetyltransferase